MVDLAEPPTAPPLGTAPRDPERARDLRGRRHHPWVRRAVLVVMTALVVAASSGRFGQTERTLRSASHPHATVQLRAPSALRSGLMWRARITITAHHRIVDPELTLAAGYVAGMQLNTVEPVPTDEDSADDALTLTYPTREAGEQLVVHLQLQVNPLTGGRQDLSLSLDGKGVGPRPVRLPAHVTVYR